MTQSWKDFEIEAVEYLNGNYNDFARFEHQGGEDSTVADIKVITNSGKEFFIEVKKSPAQCCQFVLHPNITTKSFDYSEKNSNKITKDIENIINHMNASFEMYKEAGTKGKDIALSDPTIFSNWIMNTHANKGVKFIITNNFLVVPIEKVSDYFDITAKFRVKRSGSGNAGKCMNDFYSKYIDEGKYKIVKKRVDKSKLFVESEADLNNQRFYVGDREYMFSRRGSEYELRKLSNTFNANVIFSIELKENYNQIDSSEFISHLR